MSEATARTDIANTIAVFEAMKDEVETASTGFLARYDTAAANYQPEVVTGGVRGLNTARARLRDLLAPTAVRDALGSMWAEYARQLVGTYEIPDGIGDREIIRRLADYFNDNSESVNSREFSFASVSAGGSNVGTGTIKRLTTDRYGYAIEATWAQKVTLDCVQDQSNGAKKHEEVFEIRGEARGVDLLDLNGSGNVARMQAVSTRNSLVRNASWDDRSGTDATPTAITNWTVDTGTLGTEIALDTNNLFRTQFGTSQGRSLKFDGNGKLSQALSVAGQTFDPDVPYYCCVRWNREAGSGSGATVTLTLGSQTASVAVGSTTGWNTLEIALDKGWFRQWNQTDPTVAVEITGLSSGYVLLDDLILVPMTQFDGLWYTALGGATKFVRDDTFTFTDTGGTSGVINYWLWWTYGLHLPHATGGNETWSDPT